MTKVACDAVVFCFLQPHAFQALARRQLGHPLQFARPSLNLRCDDIGLLGEITGR